MGERRSSGEEKWSPLSRPTACGECSVRRWQAALRAGTAVLLPLVRDLHGDPLPRAEIRRRGQQAGAMEVGKRLFEGTKGCFIGPGGFSFSGFPGVDTSTGRSFTFARRKEGKVAPLFSGFKTVSPPRNCGAGGGLLWWRFSFMGLGVG